MRGAALLIVFFYAGVALGQDYCQGMARPSDKSPCPPAQVDEKAKEKVRAGPPAAAK